MSLAMEMSLEKSGAHERILKVQVPADHFRSDVQKKLQTIAQRVRLNGFRPGKVPQAVLQSRFGSEAERDAVKELIDSSLRSCVEKESLRIASAPTVNIEKATLEDGVVFSATFEVYPEVTLKGMDKFPFNKAKVEVSDADRQEMIQRLRFRHAEWKEAAGPAAKDMDAEIEITAHLQGETEAFENGSVMTVRIGSAQTIPGFEDAIIGLSVGEEKSVDLPFPADYGAPKFAGKVATFRIKLLGLKAAELPALEEAFFKQIGADIADEAAFYANVDERILTAAKRLQNDQLKEKLVDYLNEQYADLSIPNGLIQQEMAALAHDHGHDHDHEHGEHCQHDHHADEAHLAADREEALRRLRLSLVIGEFVRQEKITLDEQRFRSVAFEAAMQTQQPREALGYFFEDAKGRQMIAAITLEQQAFDVLLERVAESAESVSYHDLLKKD